MAQAEFLIREWMRSTTVLRVYSNKFSITTDDFFFPVHLRNYLLFVFLF